MILLLFCYILAKRRTISFPLPYFCPDIPHFKEVIIMACSCDVCGYKSNDVKAGGLLYLSIRFQLFETLCAIWCHLYNFKNVKNTHGGVLTPRWVFFTFFKLCKWFQIAESMTITPNISTSSVSMVLVLF